MESTSATARAVKSRWANAFVLLAAAGTHALAAEPRVDFDFSRLAEYREAAPGDATCPQSEARLVEVVFPISVRFHNIGVEDVEEVAIEVDASAAGLKVYAFSPATLLATDVAQPVETTTTTKTARSLDATLGGALPVPIGEMVAHVTPSMTAAAANTKIATEKVSRMPPMQAVVVSGTSSQGGGVFFKLKRSSQTSLEGVHEVAVTFAVPETWNGGAVRLTCAARGERKVLWVDQRATFGQVAASVQLYRAGDTEMRALAERRARRDTARIRRRPSLFEAAATEIQDAAKNALGEFKS